MYILLYSHNPWHHALVGAIGALISYLMYLGILSLIAFIRGRKGKNEDVGIANQNEEIAIEATESTNDVEAEVMEHMYCRFCGKQIEKDAIFCSHCGKKLAVDSQMNPQINNLVGWSKNISVKVWKLLCKPFSYMKGLNPRSIKVGKWGKRLIVVVISAIIILGSFGLGSWIYNGFYLPYHYEALYEEGIKDVNKADEIAMELYWSRYSFRYNQHGARHRDDAIKVLTNSAEKGNVKSMVLLGRYYGYGLESYSEDGYWVRRDRPENYLEKSSYWFLQAAKLGNAEAQGELGQNYMYGFGVKQDFDKAIYWTKQGADNGDAVAQWRMGNLYESGLAYYRGNFRGYQIWWYHGAFIAKENPKERIYNGGSKEEKKMYTEMKNRGPAQIFLSPDIKKAKHYWKLAANQGLQQAKSSLEKIYEGDD